ncbi:MAG: M20 family metallopeptidase [Chloroflexota bacterium]
MADPSVMPNEPQVHPVLAAAREILPDVVDLRRRLHRVPEVGLQLPRTQELVVEAVRELGLEPRLGDRTSSVVAVIETERDGAPILLRGDMDGLPLTEETDLPFSSETGDTMHACGHDTHVAMLVGAARVLVEHRSDLPGPVVLMFQPGEEGYHGARVMLDEGVLDAAGSPVASAFALHITTRYPSGTINLRPGPLYAAADSFRILLRGRGGHASAPHLALDPIPVAAEIVLALQTIVTRRVDASHAAVVTVAKIEAGTTTNIIPEVARLAGTIRTLDEEVREEVHASLRRVVTGVAAAHGLDAEVEIEHGYPVTINDSAFTASVIDVAGAMLGFDRVEILPTPHMGAEDFSYVLRRVPGAMAFLGARPDGVDAATAPQNHSNRVVFDEAAMADGIAMLAAVALNR